MQRLAAFLLAATVLAGCTEDGSHGDTYMCADGTELDLEAFPDHHDEGFDAAAHCPGGNAADGSGGQGGAGSGAGGSGPGGAGGPGGVANTAPTANLTADRTEGEAPVSVAFEMTGTDAEGDATLWSLDVGTDGTEEANGTSLPADFTHTFEEAGTYTVTLTAKDSRDTNLTATATATIVVAEPEPAEPVEPDPLAGTCDGGDYQSFPPAGPALFYVRGTWLYEESNDLPGLQLSAETSLAGENDPDGAGCLNGDTVLV